MKLNVPGKHNILNAMAATAVGLDLDIPPRTIFQALESYTGTGRRFELKRTVRDIMVVEDYAHHPTEIKATLEAAKHGWTRRVVAVFQPHRYTRLSHLMKAFATAFNQADVLIVTEIYPAGEAPIAGSLRQGALRGDPPIRAQAGLFRARPGEGPRPGREAGPAQRYRSGPRGREHRPRHSRDH